MLFVRLSDLIGLILSQIVTFGGRIEYTSVHEILHRNTPARWMRWSERKQLLNQFHGGFLLDGKVGRVSRRLSYRSIITTGGVGVGKSAALIIPNILTANDCSLVITDTSGELYEQTSGYLASRGYRLKVLNLMDPGRSHGYNPLAQVQGYVDAEHVAHTLIESTGGGRAGEPIWDEGARRLIRIVIRALKNSPQGETAALADVLSRLNQFDAHAGGEAMDRFIVENTVDDPATFEDYKGFTNAAPEKMMLSFVSTAATALSLLGNPDIARLTRHHDFDFAAMKAEKTALYVLVRQQDMGTFRFLLSLFYTELCSALLKDRKGRLPVFLLLDEFAHLRIPNFTTFAATARKYRVGFWLILQSLSQLAANYGQEGARSILESVGTETYFGGMGLETAQNLSARLGTAFRLNWFNLKAGLHQQPLMRPDQLIRLRDNELLILYGNRDPLRIRTRPFFRRGDLRRRARLPPVDLPDPRGASP